MLLCRWASYVTGTILVLMTELGVQFMDSISILVKYSLFPVVCLLFQELAMLPGGMSQKLLIVTSDELILVKTIDQIVTFLTHDSVTKNSKMGA